LSTAEQLHLAERINAHVARLTGQAPPALPTAAALERRSRDYDDDDGGGDLPRVRKRYGVFAPRRGVWGMSRDDDDL